MALAGLFGIGLGFNMQTLVLAVQNAVTPQDMGVATSSATFFRQMGGTLGTAVFLSVLFSTVGDRITTAFREIAADRRRSRPRCKDPQVLADPANRRVVEAITGGGGLPKGALDDTSFLSQIDDRLARPFLQGFSSSMDLVFTAAAGVVFLAFLLTWFLPEEKLRTVSGIEARRQQDEELAAQAAAASASSSQMVDGVALDSAHRVPLEDVAGAALEDEGTEVRR